jgi:uncharacterized membrane protein
MWYQSPSYRHNWGGDSPRRRFSDSMAWLILVALALGIAACFSKEFREALF